MNYQILKNILGKRTLDDFVSNFWEKKPLFINKTFNSSFFLKREEIEKILSNPSLTYPFIEVVSKGKRKGDILAFSNGNNFINFKNNNAHLTGPVLSKLFNNGETLLLQKAHLLEERFFNLVREFENEILIKMSTNIYVSPKFSSSGFIPHYDTHDVFIFQLYGKKRWRIYDNPKGLPNSPFLKNENKNYLVEKPTFEKDLAVGEVLYIPRGWVHNAFTLNEESIHITLGLHRTLKPSLPNPNTKYYVDKNEVDLKTNNKLLLNTISEINELWLDGFGYNNYFYNKIEVPNFIESSEVGIVENLRYTTTTFDKYFELEIANNILQVPITAKHAILNLITKKKCKINTISKTLHDDTKIEIVKKLYKIGLVDIVNSNQSNSKVKTAINWSLEFYFDVKSDGEIINPTNYDAIPVKYASYLNSFIRKISKNKTYVINSIYLRGSLAIPNQYCKNSDIDLIIITDSKQSKELLNSFLKSNHEKSFLDCFVCDIDYFTINQDLKFIIKTQSTLLYGDELKNIISPQYLEKRIAYNSNNYDSKIKNLKILLKNCKREKDLLITCNRIMKYLLRSGFEILMIKDHSYTRSIVSCYKVLIKYHPENEIFFLQILNMAINPVTDIRLINSIINKFSKWHKSNHF